MSRLESLEIDGARLWESLERLGEVGAYTDERTGLRGINRLALTRADGEGRRLVKRWFEEAGSRCASTVWATASGGGVGPPTRRR